MDATLQKAADYLLSRREAAEVSPAGLGGDVLPSLYILDVVEAADGAQPVLPIRFIGTALDRIFGRTLTGQDIGTFIHGPRGGDVLKGFYDCAARRGAVWMRQIVSIKDGMPRFIEGIAVYLEPRRLYGALAVGEMADRRLVSQFEIAELRRMDAEAAL